MATWAAQEEEELLVVRMTDQAHLPTRATPQSAGLDLYIISTCRPACATGASPSAPVTDRGVAWLLGAELSILIFAGN